MGLGYWDGFPPCWQYTSYDLNDSHCVICYNDYGGNRVYRDINVTASDAAWDRLSMLATTECLSRAEILLFLLGESA